MVEQVPLVRILIASPNDVAEERTVAEEAIVKLNKTALHTLGLTVHALRSETDIYPSIGLDPQDVINQQFGDRHDILLGIMGARFGTPTGRADSGTEEEFNRILQRHQDSPGSVEIMMYFKDVTIARDKESLQQAIKVEEFRERISSAGVLYKTFKDPDDLARQLDVDLPLCLRSKFSKATTEGRRAVAALPTVNDDVVHRGEPVANDDLGYLDYAELFQDSMQRLGSFTAEITLEMRKFNDRTVARTEELKATKTPDGGVDVKRAKLVANKAAADYDEFATMISGYIKILSRESHKAVEALQAMLMMASDFQRPSDEQKKSISEPIEGFLDAVSASRRSIVNFAEVMVRMPRMTSKFNKAKTSLVKALSALVEELEKTEILFSGILGPIKRL